MYYYKSINGEGYSLHSPDEKRREYFIASFVAFTYFISRLKRNGFFN